MSVQSKSVSGWENNEILWLTHSSRLRKEHSIINIFAPITHQHTNVSGQTRIQFTIYFISKIALNQCVCVSSERLQITTGSNIVHLNVEWKQNRSVTRKMCDVLQSYRHTDPRLSATRTLARPHWHRKPKWAPRGSTIHGPPKWDANMYAVD